VGLSKRLAWWFSVGLTASLLAFAIFVMLSLDIMRSSSVKNGDWHTNLLAGDAEAGIYQKAVISIVGLLASTRKDSIYYLANTADGKPFSLNCDYRLEGGSLDADWWSITAYGRDAFLIPNSDNRYSFNNANVARDEKGGFSIVVSSERREGNWLPVGYSEKGLLPTDADFDLTLRIYAPGNDYLKNPGTALLPTLVEENCR